MKIPVFFILILASLTSFSQVKKIYPVTVEAALKKAGTNRSELEKAITFYKKSGDPLKLKATYFLIANMDIHYSLDYYWTDSLGHKIAFDELAYPNFETAQQALESLKSKTPGMIAQPVVLEDIKNIKAAYLISNVENAFRKWQGALTQKVSFKDFCEYILPYRVTVEPLQNWRTIYEGRFKWVSDSLKVTSMDKTLYYLSANCQTWFTDTWGKEKRDEPLPRLGALQLLLRKKGACEDITALQAFILRSQGIPVSYNAIPYWATSTGSHYFNTVFNADAKAIQYDAPNTTSPVNYKSPREPSKVLRLTYSKQPGTLAAFYESEKIPEGIMRTQNYIDITNEIWESADVKCPQFSSENKVPITYACVFSGGYWQPTWWGKAKKDSVTFTTMPKGVVYLPVYYENNDIIPAGYPVVEGYNHEIVLAPDTVNKRTITINEQERYLIFRPGKNYELYYWDTTWKLTGTKIAENGAHTLQFEGVPTNVLFRLVPEYSQGYERPFIITGDGNRAWF